MGELQFPLIALAVCAPLIGAWAVGLADSAGRRKAVAMLASALSALSCIEILRETAAAGYSALAEPLLGELFLADALSAAPLALFSIMAFAVIAASSNFYSKASILRVVLLLQAGTLAAYAAATPAMFALAWVACSVIPLLDRRAEASSSSVRAPALALTASSAFLLAGLGVLCSSSQGATGWIAPWSTFWATTDNNGGVVAFVLLMLAVYFRKGLFPFHGWVTAAHERGHLTTAALMMNGHMAAFLVLRVVMPLFPAISSEALVLLTDAALLTALYAALLALAERSPRRIFSLLLVSQSSFVLAGLETGTPAGVSGALVYWMVVTIAATALAIVLQGVEQRLRHSTSDGAFLGLAGPFPRLATFFVVCGVALVGMPGTLGFIADELLLHGALESHPRLGLVMPAAAALNAFHLYRLFSRLFLGSQGPKLSGTPDARWGERLALTGALALLIVGGLLPAKAVGLRSAAADAVVNRLSLESLISPGD